MLEEQCEIAKQQQDFDSYDDTEDYDGPYIIIMVCIAAVHVGYFDAECVHVVEVPLDIVRTVKQDHRQLTGK